MQSSDEMSRFEELDKKIIEKMDKDGKFCFDINQVDRKIIISTPSKCGSRLFLFRIRKQKEIPFVNAIKQNVTYYVINDDGVVVGKIPTTTTNSSTISMDYWLKEDARGQGIGTIMLNEVVDQIFVEQDVDDLCFRNPNQTEIESTKITTITLDINEDNYASQRIAEKNGFAHTGEGRWEIQRDDYLKIKELNEERTF